MTRNTIETRTVGLSNRTAAEPCILVIFGASGDLTHRELIPALYELAHQELLPAPFAMVGFARSGWSDDDFRERMRDAVQRECTFDEKTWRAFSRQLFFVPGDFNAPADGDYAALQERIASVRADIGAPDNVMFHLATPPTFFPTIVDKLEASGLTKGEGWRRLVIEKPFGEDERTARALDQTLRSVFAEEQIYRIDHFLGKETVQNMLVFRFANPSFEPIWNRNFIDHVQITVAEDIGIGTRAGFYEKTGVVRDMMQNHLLSLLCMTAIEPPLRFNGPALRDETVKVLEAVEPLGPDRAVRGQYAAGTVGDAPARGYREEDRVASDSVTPTFVAAKLTIDNWRWAGVPFYLRTGKRMPRKLTEVAIHFKATPHLMFPQEHRDGHSNMLTFRLQPEEGIVQTFAAKQPGPTLRIENVRSSFLYASAFGVTEPPRAYAWLLLDVMEGDQTLFARADWIDRAWQIVDPLIATWEADAPADFPNYTAGSWGPAAADALLQKDGREWTVI
ncbi:MAG TPA: glucose-6-phosphate dehydrogenase [Gemmatimonadales bacterium]|nr:glucose-6-phosphate dehydrogenase [Gemmatimonadales bacterium]